MNHNDGKVAQYQRAVTPTLESSVGGGSGVRGKVLNYSGTTPIRNRLTNNLVGTNSPTANSTMGSYSLLRGGVTRTNGSFSGALNIANGGILPNSNSSVSEVTVSSKPSSSKHSSASMGGFGVGNGRDEAFLTPLSVLPRYDLEPLSEEIPADGVIFARVRNQPDSLVVFRTPEERLRNPERLNLDRRSLQKCPILEQEQRLRLLNYQNNAIATIEHLENLPNLIFLDFYNNKLTSLQGPLHHVKGLRVLMAGKNKIGVINNLSHLRKLDVLDLHSNDIATIENLDELQELRVLNLAGNRIVQVNNLTALQSLTELNLRRNCISSVSGLDALPALQRIFLSHNSIGVFEDVQCVFQVKHLIELSLDGNPIAQYPDHLNSSTSNAAANVASSDGSDKQVEGANSSTSNGASSGYSARYRQYVVAKIATLKHLDLKRVTEEERVLAIKAEMTASLPANNNQIHSGVSSAKDGTNSNSSFLEGEFSLPHTTSIGSGTSTVLNSPQIGNGSRKQSLVQNITQFMQSDQSSNSSLRQQQIPPSIQSLNNSSNRNANGDGALNSPNGSASNYASTRSTANVASPTSAISASSNADEASVAFGGSNSTNVAGISSSPVMNGITLQARSGSLTQGLQLIDIEVLSPAHTYLTAQYADLPSAPTSVPASVSSSPNYKHSNVNTRSPKVPSSSASPAAPSAAINQSTDGNGSGVNSPVGGSGKALVCVGDKWDWSALLTPPPPNTSNTPSGMLLNANGNGNSNNSNNNMPQTVKRLLSTVTEIVLCQASLSSALHRLCSHQGSFLSQSFPQLVSVACIHSLDVQRLADLDGLVQVLKQVESLRHVVVTGNDTPLFHSAVVQTQVHVQQPPQQQFALHNQLNPHHNHHSNTLSPQSSAPSTSAGSSNELWTIHGLVRSYLIAQLPQVTRVGVLDVRDDERQHARQRWHPVLTLRKVTQQQQVHAQQALHTVLPGSSTARAGNPNSAREASTGGATGTAGKRPQSSYVSNSSNAGTIGTRPTMFLNNSSNNGSSSNNIQRGNHMVPGGSAGGALVNNLMLQEEGGKMVRKLTPKSLQQLLAQQNQAQVRFHFAFLNNMIN